MEMEIIGPLILSFLAGLSTILGGLIIYFKIKNINNFITISLAFSITIMILISLFDLLPNSVIILINIYNKLLGIILSIITFLLGYLTIYIINFNSDKSLYRIGMLSMISLMLHNFPEGIAVFMSGYTNMKYGIKMFIAIMMHNIPEGLSIAVPLYYSGKSRGYALKKTFISGITEPIGAILSFIFLRNFFNNLLLSFILIFVSGLMISLSVNEIYKEINKYNNNLKYLGYIIGIFIFIVINLLLK